MFAKAVQEHRTDVVKFMLENGMTPDENAHLLHLAAVQVVDCGFIVWM